jgi:hypothetical protein
MIGRSLFIRPDRVCSSSWRVAVRFILGGVAQAFMPGVFSDDETGGMAALKPHGLTAVGLTGVPGNVVKPAFSADDALV